MKKENLSELLGELADRQTEQPRPGLAEEIKHHIPHRVMPHKHGLDTINIIIDLRINKLVAAAIIVLAMILLAHFFAYRDSQADSIYQDARMLVAYLLHGDTDESSLSAVKARYESLVEKGEEAALLGTESDLGDSNAVLLHWKNPDGRYKVIFGDLRETTIDAAELIKLQAQMVQNRAEKR